MFLNKCLDEALIFENNLKIKHDMKTLEDVKKWLKIVQKAEIFIFFEKDKSPIFHYNESDNVSDALSYIDDISNMLMAGNYTVKARTKNSSNNSFVVNNYSAGRVPASMPSTLACRTTLTVKASIILI